ncbi:hypothetical protein GCM10010329_82790 [Streptomyces spiroverticillatus]|uniref:Uncharacterized protein n=1 Tax=Streptomyces finlayi TaxID=67296 RepID=A0A918X9D2_9ACTN|nr:hypothetical protein [Streptomyces finlayi]GHA47806.1 hypothetical protein GCM10010329_82790 [Streptomyces spiroverticillatus]GHD18753.1 hypothetical protein GCM10010334_81860 [Streptomyces finlayi]
MNENTSTITEPTVQPAPASGMSTASVFAPALSASAVVTATRGRQVFNDSDKSNYFEG